MCDILTGGDINRLRCITLGNARCQGCVKFKSIRDMRQQSGRPSVTSHKPRLWKSIPIRRRSAYCPRKKARRAQSNITRRARPRSVLTRKVWNNHIKGGTFGGVLSYWWLLWFLFCCLITMDQTSIVTWESPNKSNTHSQAQLYHCDLFCSALTPGNTALLHFLYPHKSHQWATCVVPSCRDWLCKSQFHPHCKIWLTALRIL